jgi:hypothetical protein
LTRQGVQLLKSFLERLVYLRLLAQEVAQEGLELDSRVQVRVRSRRVRAEIDQILRLPEGGQSLADFAGGSR